MLSKYLFPILKLECGNISSSVIMLLYLNITMLWRLTLVIKERRLSNVPSQGFGITNSFDRTMIKVELWLILWFPSAILDPY